MKLHLTDTTDINVVRSYHPGKVVIKDQTYESSMIITPQKIIPNWQPQEFDDFEPSHFVPIADLEPEIVVLGTGNTLRFPDPSLTACLTNLNIGVEVMDTAAACRTYNILAQENRHVVAALLMQHRAVRGNDVLTLD